METVTNRELRNHGGEVVGRVEAGAHALVTRVRSPLAELRPLHSRGVNAAALLERWRRLPTVDAGALRAVVDHVIHHSP